MEPDEDEKVRMAQRAAAIEARYESSWKPETVETPMSAPDVHVSNEGGETSMSISETNKLRLSLGLKPLVDTSMQQEDVARAEHKRHGAAQAEKQRDKDQKDVRERLSTAKERRRLDAQLKKSKALGSHDQHGDDVGSWLRDHKKLVRKKQEEDEQKRELDEIAGDDEEPSASTPYMDMSGAKMKASAADVDNGQTVILTLADADIMDEDGNIAEDTDVLEAYDKNYQADIDKGKRAAKKKNLHFEEDGKRLNLLNKYDEEESEMLLALDADGTVDTEARELEIEANIAANELTRGAMHDAYGSNSATQRERDYLTADELAAAARPTAFKKRTKRDSKKSGKTRKVRKREVVDDEDEGRGDDARDMFDELEAVADDNDRDRGNRSKRRRMDQEDRLQDDLELEARSARFDLALQKANYASLAMRQEAEAAAQVPGGDDDEALMESIAQARTKRQREEVGEEDAKDRGLNELAEEVARQRDAEELEEQAGAGQGDVLTETHDFVSGLAMGKQEDEEKVPVKEESDAEDDKVKPMEEETVPPPETGGWVQATIDPKADTADLPSTSTEQHTGSERSGRRYRSKPHEADAGDADEAERGRGARAAAAVDAVPLSGALGRQGGLRRGLMGALQLLRDSGGMKDVVSWAGRSSDQKGNRLDQVKEALLDDETQLSFNVGAALQRRDDHGRILTPKEAFRDISYEFHGMKKAVSKKEKIMKTIAKDRAGKSSLYSDNPSQILDMFKQGLWKPPLKKNAGKPKQTSYVVKVGAGTGPSTKKARTGVDTQADVRKKAESAKTKRSDDPMLPPKPK